MSCKSPTEDIPAVQVGFFLSGEVCPDCLYADGQVTPVAWEEPGVPSLLARFNFAQRHITERGVTVTGHSEGEF